MNHEEYVSRIESFTDSPEDAASVLAHAASCTACRRESREAERAMARLEPKRASRMEEIARWSAAAAILALVVFGIRKEAREPGGPARFDSEARYVIVGDASGVVAHTPEGVVVGFATPASSRGKETNK
jgi:hypothetical protein